MATYVITNTFQHIVLTGSEGEVRSIPKTNLVIYRLTKNAPGGGTQDVVHLNWPAGDYPRAQDSFPLAYTEVTSPTLTSNAALEALLKSWTGTPTYLLTNLTSVHVVDHYAIIGNEDAVLGLVYEDGVARADLAGKTLKQGLPIFAGLGGAGVFTHIKLTSGSVFICPTGAESAPYTTSTTSTTTT